MTANTARPQDPWGFGGQVANLSALVSTLPTRGRVLHLPDEGVVDGAFLRLPEGNFDGAVVSGLPESLGALAPFLRALRQRLVDGAGVVLDVANAQCLPALRAGLEGKARSVDPIGAAHDPERTVHRRDLLRLLADAGFVVHDVFEVPSFGEPLAPALCEALMAQGILPFALRNGPPPRRFWVQATAMPAPRGSVVLGPGSAEAVARTRASLAFLPDGVELVPCAGDNEAIAFATGLVRSAGEWVWFLRAGTQVDGLAFAALRGQLQTCLAVVPGRDGVATAPGDLSGLMLWRSDMLALGSFTRRYTTPQIAYEDLCLAVDAHLGPPALVAEGTFTTPPAPRQPGDANAEAVTLLQQWQQVGLERDPTALARSACLPDPPWVGRKPRLSLVMMVKNETQTLARCLRSVRDRVDEIVIVDTGSTDDTIAIASSFGARVLENPWADDFSAPRNVGLAAATGDWILVLDADETLAPDQGDRLRDVIRNPAISGYQLVLQNEYGDGSKTVGVAILRLFRNLPGIRFQNRIHEQVLPTLQAEGSKLGLRLAPSDLVVLHDGYTDARMAERGKDARNDQLFKLQLQDTPDDIYALYKYGDFLRRVQDRRAAALPVLEHAWSALRAHPVLPAGELPYAAEIGALLALELACNEEFGRARTILAAAFRDYMPTPNLHYVAAGVAAHEQRPHDSIAHFRACLAFAGQVLVVPIQEGVTSYVALAGIAQAYLRLGDRRRAQELVAQARALRPDFEVTTLLMSNLFLQDGEPGRALSVLTEHLEHNPDCAGVCQQAAVILSRLGCVDQARSMGQRAVRLLDGAQLRTEAQRARQFVQSLG